MIPPFTQIQTTDDVSNRVQANIAKTLNPIVALPMIQSDLLPKVKLYLNDPVTGATGYINAIQHKLGRALQGWAIVRLRANSQVWDVQDTNKTPGATLLLRVSADAVVDLIVF